MAGHRIRSEVRALKKAQWLAAHPEKGAPAMPVQQRVVGNPGLLRLPNLVAPESPLEKYGAGVPLVVTPNGSVVAAGPGSPVVSLAPVVVPDLPEVTAQDLLARNPPVGGSAARARAKAAAVPLVGHTDRWRLVDSASLQSVLYAVGALFAANQIVAANALFTLAEQRFHPERGTAWSDTQESAILSILNL